LPRSTSFELTRPIRWSDVYSEAELYKAALRVYTKPLFHWRKALSTSVDGRTLYDFAGRGLRSLGTIHQALQRRTFTFRPAMALLSSFNGKPTGKSWIYKTLAATPEELAEPLSDLKASGHHLKSHPKLSLS